jgi:hypothetical protein
MDKKKDWILILTNDKNRALALSLLKCLEQKNIQYKETIKGIEIRQKDIDKLTQDFSTTKNKKNEQ